MADEEYIGLNSVMIMSDDALVPENIKEGTSIFGVEGTYKATDVTFTVADGNNAPSNPQNNVIWVQTDTEIPSYAILSSVERPSNPAEGMVWIVNGQTSSGAFDLTIDDNMVAIYPQKAYQYVNGEWTPRPIKVYKDGQWIDLFTATLNITYPEGTFCECTDGVITYVAPDTTGIWELTIPNQGTWITSCSGGNGGLIEPVSTQVTNNEEIIDVNVVYFTATLEVTYPRGTCTATLGDQTYTHSGGGTASFVVNNKGTYNIKIVYNTLSKTGTAAISTYGSTVTKSLDYSKYIFNNGDVSSITGGWSSGGCSGFSNSTSLYVYKNGPKNNNTSYAYPCTNNLIDLTDYTTITFTFSTVETLRLSWGSNVNASNCHFYYGVMSGKNSSLGTKGETRSGGTYNLNISSLKGSYYVGFNLHAYGTYDENGWVKAYITHIKLS